jgi:1-acyl-sn-glycerol-3-phosphate acyltransferase
MYLVGMIMVDRNWTKDEGSIKRAFGRIKDKEGGEKSVWVVSYLEGTRRSEVKLEEVRERLKSFEEFCGWRMWS